MINWKKAVKNNFSGNNFVFSFYRKKKRCNNIFNFDVETTSYYIYPDGSVHNYDYTLSADFTKTVERGDMSISGCLALMM